MDEVLNRIGLEYYLTSLSLSLALSKVRAKTSATTCTDIRSAAFAASLRTPKWELSNPLLKNCTVLKQDTPIPELYSRPGRGNSTESQRYRPNLNVHIVECT